jgi:hypothetical protein
MTYFAGYDISFVVKKSIIFRCDAQRGFWSQFEDVGGDCSPSSRQGRPLLEYVLAHRLECDNFHTAEEVLMNLLSVRLWDKPGDC